MLLDRKQPAPAREVIDRILAEAERAAEIVRRLRDFFRAGTTRLEAVAVDELLAEMRRMADGAIGTRPIALAIRYPAPVPPLYVDRLQVEVILRNLLVNAVESLAAAGVVDGRIEVSVQGLDNDRVLFAVVDNGPGITAAARAGLFEPFVSGKPTGMGLGLAVSRAIAEAHGGSLDAAKAARGEFHLILPCVPAA
jgi:C4-dicarboxylate-specific signal transduction histidine kinase